MKYYLLFILCGCLFLAPGCADILDYTPENSLTFENAFETEEELAIALSSVGKGVKSSIGVANYIYPRFFGEYMDVCPSFFDDMRNLNYDMGGTQWRFLYQVIDQANIVLRYANLISISDHQREYYRGAAYFYKAFTYLDLIRRWGDCVLVKEGIELNPLPKTEWVKVADYAIELAKEAVRLMPEYDGVKNFKGEAPNYRSTPCKGAANALLAHLCAWKAGGKYLAKPESRDYDENELWDIAEKACTAIITQTGIYGLLANPEEVCTKVLVGETKESVFEMSFKDLWHETSDASSVFLFGNYYQAVPLKPEVGFGGIKNAWFQIFPSSVRAMYPGGDKRKDAYFYKLDSLAHDTLLPITGGFAYPNKWRYALLSTNQSSMGTFENINQNKIVWRLADIYLLRAECRARLGNSTGAIEDLNAIRDRAGAARYQASEHGGDLRYTIFKEREKELLMEGDRYFDVIRNGYYRTELEPGFQKVSEQNIIDGCFFLDVASNAFEGNPLMRPNTYWAKRR